MGAAIGTVAVGCVVDGLYIPGACRFLGPQPTHHLEMTPFGRIGACCCAPRTVLAAGPLQELEVAAPGGIGACPRVPRAALFAGACYLRERSAAAGPLEDHEMAT